MGHPEREGGEDDGGAEAQNGESSPGYRQTQKALGASPLPFSHEKLHVAAARANSEEDD